MLYERASDMTMRGFLFGGAAGLMLAAAAAVPALAQYNDEFSDTSTPAERAQTEQLNRNAASGRVMPADRSQYDSARSDYESAQQRYQQQLDEYNAKTRQYDSDRQRYNQSVDTYSSQQNVYDNQQGVYDNRQDVYRDRALDNDSDLDDATTLDYPDQVGVAPRDDLWTLDRFSNPNNELYNAPVVDIDGIGVGHFRRIETRDSGDRMVVITLNSLQTVALPIQEIFYDPRMSVVVAERTSYEIDRAPTGPFGN
jgi:hypothetical protein